MVNYVSKNFHVYVQCKPFMLTYSEVDGKMHLKIRLLLLMRTDMDTRDCCCYNLLCLANCGKHISNVCNGKSILAFYRRFFLFRCFHSAGLNFFFHIFGNSWLKLQFSFFLLLNSLFFVNTAIQKSQNMNISYYHLGNIHKPGYFHQ
jgi:hypothetical protein